ncbi:hypothetical protein MPER_08002 [Moniliophthora perniciosa FA553]|nr:hypothetical protein MPER_08002 [Moniliophthora perniciosa FA553]
MTMDSKDMNMPGDTFLLPEGDSAATGSWWGANLTAYVQSDTIPEARLDDMVTRIVASWYLLGQDSPDYPSVNFDSFSPLDESVNEHIDVQDDHAELVRTIGAASTVLLKNENGALPLTGKERSIFLAGSDAGPPSIGPNRFANQQGLEDGVLAMGWGSGTTNFTYLISPYEAIQQRARKHRTSLSWSFDDYDLAMAGNMAVSRDVALVFIAADSGEGALWYVEPNPIEPNGDGDRLNLTSWHNGEDLILAVAEQNNNTIVVVNSVGPLIVESWINHPNVTAVLWAGLQGSETGNAITDVLYGDWNPSARLPYTIAKSVDDYSAHLIQGGGKGDIISVDYTEGFDCFSPLLLMLTLTP